MKIPFHRPHITNKEFESIKDSLLSGWLTMGPKTLQFELAFKSYLNVDYSISVNSATAALHLALNAIGVKQGDEVIIPTNTFVATAEAVAYSGAIPVLCDIEPNYHNIIWNGLNEDGQSVASGRYILKMSAPGYAETITMTLLK